MVVHDRALRQTPWQEWRALLVACHDYAVISGWRFVNADFMNLSQKRHEKDGLNACLLYTSPSPRDRTRSRMPSSA